jgi:YD repeat-containing protein
MKSKIMLIAILMFVTFAGLCQNGNENGNGNGNNKGSIVAVPVSPTPLSLTTNTTATLQSTLNLTQNKLYPIAPNAAELGRFSAVQVGLFTGTAQYSIPIYEFKTPNLSLPIMLDYSSNGLVVDKIGSWVGYDWSLNVGGVINRNRKGKFDRPGKRPAGPYTWSHQSLYERKCYLDQLLTENRDLEPDEFTFTFPNYSGKFFIDSLGVPVSFPYSNLKIETNTTGESFDFFMITTPDGIVYKFEDRGYTYPIADFSYVSSWYLSQIIHPAGDVINFSYTSYTFDQYLGVVQSATTVVGRSGQEQYCTTSEMSEKVNKISTSSLFLDNITIPGHGSIVFERKSRQDSYLDYRLRKITVKDNLNNPVKHFVFYHQYPTNSTSFSCKTILTSDLYASSTGWHKKRMFLDSLQIQGDDTTKRLCSYKFYYNNLTELPGRFSYAQDHWGYFNGKSNIDFALRSEIPSSNLSAFNNLIATNADRNPDYTYAQKGMLQKIIFPTGGFTTIEYEPNKNGAGSIVGGCRVLRTKSYQSATGLPDIKKYLYSSVQSSINYKYYDSYVINHYDIYYQLIASCTLGVLSSNSYYSLVLNGRYHVLYGQIEILSGENGENGKEVHLFNTDVDTPATPLNGRPIYPLVMYNTGWKSGLPETDYTINSSLTEIWRKTLTYIPTATTYKVELKCLAVEKYYDPSSFSSVDFRLLHPYNVIPYMLTSYFNYINNEQVTKYESNGSVSTTTNYYYDNNKHCSLSREVFADSDGTMVEKRYYYPHDYNAVENFSTLIRKWIIANPVDVRTYRGTKLVDGEQNQYNDNGQLTDIYKLESSNGTDIAFNQAKPFTFPHKHKLEYKANNCINIETPENDVKSYYLWDTSGKYLMAKITGNTVNWDNISPYNNLNYSTLSRDLWTNLKSVSGDAFITTYSYKPLTGLTSQTDPAGRTTYYDYDTFGRLKLVKDLNQNILKKMEYHYAGQN